MRQPLQVLVIGAGAAGSAAAVALRERVHEAAQTHLEVRVVGAEDRLPYNRTTVNKGLLSGDVDDAGIALPGMADLGVEWWTGSVAEALDARARIVTLRDGARLRGDAVVLATGAAPRSLPAPVEDAARDRVLQLRTAVDTHRLRALVDGAGDGGSRRVVVAGAGLIGTEAAAVLQGLRCQVSLVDASPLPMARHVGPRVAAWMVSAHRDAGVDLHLGTRIAGVRADGAGVLVDLTDGQSLRAAALVACLGVEPATAWLNGSGLPMPPDAASPGTGVVVDAGQRVVGFPGIYAAGDLAAMPGPDGYPRRVEHWGAALEQGRVTAASVLTDLGVPTRDDAVTPVRAVPSYSTYVHTTKVTILGWPMAAVTERAVLGSPADARFALALLDTADRVVAAVGVGGARAVNTLRPLIERRAAASELDPPPLTSRVLPPSAGHAAGPADPTPARP